MARILTSKIFILFAFLSCLANSNFAADKTKHTSNTISVPSSFPQETLQDIQSLLQQATGQTWTTTKENMDKGVILTYNKVS